MKRIALSLLAITTVATAIPAVASAQPNRGPIPYDQHHRDYRPAPAPWQSITLRKVMLDRRIDQGVRNRTLTRREAANLRAEFNAIVRQEAAYKRSRPGLTMAERADLDRRFDRLSAKIRFERNDRDDRGPGGYNNGPRR